MAENLDDRVSAKDKVTPGSSTPFSIEHTPSIAPHSPPITTKMMKPNDSIGGIRIDAHIHSGGMGDVYKGMDPEFGEVSIKVLQKRYLNEEKVVRRFREEAAAVALLDHPHIIKILKYGDEEGMPYMVNPYVKHDLGKIQLTLEENVEVMLQVAKALHYAHSNEGGKKQIIHRDVKPENILVSENPLHAYVIDLGIGKIVQEETGATEGDALLGTPEYMAPEQAINPKDVTPKADVYAWACTFYSVLSRIGARERQDSTNNFEIMSHRRNYELMHELWLNEAVEAGIEMFTKSISEAHDDTKRKKWTGARERLAKVSDLIEWMIMEVLREKNPEKRPTFDVIIPRVEYALKNDKLRRIELSENETAERAKSQGDLKKKIEGYSALLAGKDENSDEAIKVRFLLANDLVGLARITEKNDGWYHDNLKEALKHFSAVESKVDIEKRRGNVFSDIDPSKIGEIRSAIARELPEAEARKSHFESKILDKEYTKLFDAAEQVLDKDLLVDAEQLFLKIDYDKLNNQSLKERYIALTTRIEEMVDDVVKEGIAALETDFKTAKKESNRVMLLNNMLPKFSDARKKAAGFDCVVRIYEFKQDYADHESKKNYLGMVTCVKGMEKLLSEENFPADKREEHQKLVEKVKAELKKYDYFEDFIAVKEKANTLETDLKNHAGEVAQVSGETIKYLPSEVINDYKERVNREGKKLKLIDAEKVGAEYKGVEDKLRNLETALQVAEWVHGVAKGSFPDKLKNLNSLVAYYHNKSGPDEQLYVSLNLKLLQTRLDQLKGNS